MLKKILMVSLILCGFLLASVSTVVAADVTVTDNVGDVFNAFTYEEVTSSQNIDIDNIDIVEITYSRQGKTITLTMEVKGEIEDRGSINDIAAEDNIEYVLYMFILYYISGEVYYVFYVNNACQITNETENITVSDFSAQDSTLTVTFDALFDDEIYESIDAYTYYYKIPNVSDIDDLSENDYEALFDSVPDEESLIVVIDAPSEGEVGEDIDFVSEVFGGSEPYTYAWDFDDGKTSDDENPTHKFDAAGTYTVTLTVTDADSNKYSDYISIVISEDGTSNGGSTNGNNQDNSNNAILLFAAIIVIIVIVGIVVVVLIIRR